MILKPYPQCLLIVLAKHHPCSLLLNSLQSWFLRLHVLLFCLVLLSSTSVVPRCHSYQLTFSLVSLLYVGITQDLAHAICASLYNWHLFRLVIAYAVLMAKFLLQFLNCTLKLATKFTILSHLNTVQCVRECKLKTPKTMPVISSDVFPKLLSYIFTCQPAITQMFYTYFKLSIPKFDITIIF